MPDFIDISRTADPFNDRLHYFCIHPEPRDEKNENINFGMQGSVMTAVFKNKPIKADPHHKSLLQSRVIAGLVKIGLVFINNLAGFQTKIKGRI